MAEINQYKTSDLAIVTTLSLNFPIVSLNKINDQKIEFVFDKTPGLEEFIALMWRGEIRIDPQVFFNQLKIIKTRIREQG